MASQRFDDPEQGFGAAVPVDGKDDNDAGSAREPDRRPVLSWARVFTWIRARVRARPAHRPLQRDVASLSDHLLRDIGLEPRSAWQDPGRSAWDRWRS